MGCPTRVLDLDPDPEVPWSAVVDATRAVKEKLEELGLDYVRTARAKGLRYTVHAPSGVTR